MQTITRPPKITLRVKLTFIYAAVTLATVLCSEAAALLIIRLLFRQPVFTLLAWGVHTLLAVSVTSLVGFVLGVWISHRVTRRLRHALQVSQAWMRGNLALRITDTTKDTPLHHRTMNLARHRPNKGQGPSAP